MIPISSIKDKPDGQEGLQLDCLPGNSFSCTKTSQQSVNILQYFDFQLLAGKALRQGADQIRSVPLLSLSWWSLVNIPCDSNLINQRQARWSRGSTTPLPSGELFLLHKEKSTISECSPVYWFSAFGWNSIRTGGRSNLYLTPYWAYLDKIKYTMHL